jgi:hypothetical protein
VALSTAYGSGLDTLSASASEMRRTSGGPGGIEFSLVFEPDARNISLGFSKWANLIKDLRPIFTDVVYLFRSHERRHFSTQGKSTGDKFYKLSTRPPPKGGYKAWKKRHFPGRPILQLTGTLRAALGSGGRGGVAPGGMMRIGLDGLEVGLDASTEVGKYGMAHSRAEGPAYRRQSKPRPPVRYSTQVVPTSLDRVGFGGDVPLATAIAQIFQVHIVRARKKAFAKQDPFAKAYDWRKMRRGVMRLKTR